MTTPAGPPAARGGRLSTWVRQHRGAAIALGAGAAAGAFVLIRRHAGASSAANQSSTSTGTTGTIPAGYTDNQAGYDSLETQIANLQTQLANVTTSTSLDGTQPPPPTTRPAVTTPPPPRPASPAMARIPNVVGWYATPALAAVRAAGFQAHTDPYRNPVSRWKVTSTTPSGSAPRGSSVTLNVAVSR